MVAAILIPFNLLFDACLNQYKHDSMWSYCLKPDYFNDAGGYFSKCQSRHERTNNSFRGREFAVPL